MMRCQILVGWIAIAGVAIVVVPGKAMRFAKMEITSSGVQEARISDQREELQLEQIEDKFVEDEVVAGGGQDVLLQTSDQNQKSQLEKLEELDSIQGEAEELDEMLSENRLDASSTHQPGPPVARLRGGRSLSGLKNGANHYMFIIDDHGPNIDLNGFKAEILKSGPITTDDGDKQYFQKKRHKLKRRYVPNKDAGGAWNKDRSDKAQENMKFNMVVASWGPNSRPVGAGVLTQISANDPPGRIILYDIFGGFDGVPALPLNIGLNISLVDMVDSRSSAWKTVFKSLKPVD